MAGAGVQIDVSLVRRLLAEQFPQWADLPLAPVASAGTDNALYRLGEDKVVRLPRVDWAAGTGATEGAWLPKLAAALPLATPVPLAMGEPVQGYPWNWTVCRWLDGEDAFASPIADMTHAAEALAGFLRALWEVDATGGPLCGVQNNLRGMPLARMNRRVRAAIAVIQDEIDADIATRAWEAALATPVWQGPGVWLHGDLHPGNLLVEKGRLSAVIDFGTMGVGDPAADVMAAWSTLDAEGRGIFRAGLDVDDATWARGRGWALYNGLGALASYRDSNPTLSAIARRMITQALAS